MWLLIVMTVVIHLGTGAAHCQVLSLIWRPKLFRSGTMLRTGSGGQQGRPCGAGSRVPHSLSTPFSQHSLPTFADTSSILTLPELSEAPLAPSPEWPWQQSEARWAQVLRMERQESCDQ